MSVKCKKCGLEFKDKDEIKESTRAEHLKHVGHQLDVD